MIPVMNPRTYANAPATFEVIPVLAAEGAVPGAAGAALPTGAPHEPQKVVPSAICAPHFAQNAMPFSPFAESLSSERRPPPSDQVHMPPNSVSACCEEAIDNRQASYSYHKAASETSKKCACPRGMAPMANGNPLPRDAARPAPALPPATRLPRQFDG